MARACRADRTGTPGSVGAVEAQVAQRAKRYDRDLVGLARGVAVWLGAGARPDTSGAAAVTTWIDASPDALPEDLVADVFVSSGALWRSDDLVVTLRRLADHLAPGGQLAFCEPTVDALHGRTRPGVTHDVTAALWEAGWSPQDWRRFTVAGQWGIPWSFVKGVARRTPPHDDVSSR